jgi:hypothetical protein
MKIPTNINYGHQLGICYVNPSTKCSPKFAYIPIHKNASTWTISYLTSLGWSMSNINLIKEEYIPLVIIRKDIIQRWVSGITEVYTSLTNKTFIKELKNPTWHPLNDTVLISNIFSRVVFESHTDMQINFLQGVDIPNTVFFDMHSNFKDTFVKYLQNYNIYNKHCMPHNSYMNQTSTFRHKKQIYNKFRAYASEPKFNKKLSNVLADDIKFVNSVQCVFHNSKS